MIERYSMDEYFMEIDFLKDRSRKEIDDFAHRLQECIYEVTTVCGCLFSTDSNLVGAVGIARSKTYAKLSSSLDKPKGRA